MNQQIFFSPWVPSSFCPLWLSSYSHTWESCLHLLCQYTQFSFASQLLYFDLLLCCWISSCSYQLSTKYIFSVQIAWFYLIPSYIWYCWPQWLTLIVNFEKSLLNSYLVHFGGRLFIITAWSNWIFYSTPDFKTSPDSRKSGNKNVFVGSEFASEEITFLVYYKNAAEIQASSRGP